MFGRRQRAFEMASKAKRFRKRARDSDDDEAVASASVVRPTVEKKPINTFGTATTKKSADNETSTTTSSAGLDVAYASSGTGKAHEYGGGAFSYEAKDTAADKDARAMLEKKLAMQEQRVQELEEGKKVYRGQAAYTNFIMKDAKEAVAEAKVKGTLGPTRAPTNVRGICRIDYQPDVCKDYKETGQCGFGDSCKFLHDRSDYKSGWQIELDWQAQQKKKAEKLAKKLEAGGTIEDSDSDEDGAEGAAGGPTSGAASKKAKAGEEELPFACFLCRQPFRSPIQTQCGHYFCESCAVARHRSNPLCGMCGKATHGIFNAAPKLTARLKELQRKKMEGAGDAGSHDGVGAGSGFIEIDNGSSGSAAAGRGDDGGSTPSDAGGDSDASTDDEATLATKAARSSKQAAASAGSSGGEAGGGWAIVS